MNALDELRYAGRILNLRESLPRAAEAVRRAENFLREHQVRGSAEVLIITGRGNQSVHGIGVLRAEVEKLLFSLRRRGVVAEHHSHNPGAFVVRLASLTSLLEAPARHRDRSRQPPAPAIEGLSDDTNDLLRQLAERSLDELGVRPDEGAIENEMHRHARILAPSLPGGAAMEGALRDAIRQALAQYDS